MSSRCDAVGIPEARSPVYRGRHTCLPLCPIPKPTPPGRARHLDAHLLGTLDADSLPAESAITAITLAELSAASLVAKDEAT